MYNRAFIHCKISRIVYQKNKKLFSIMISIDRQYNISHETDIDWLCAHIVRG